MRVLARYIPEIAAFCVSLIIWYINDISFFQWLVLWVALDLMTASESQLQKIYKRVL